MILSDTKINFATLFKKYLKDLGLDTNDSFLGTIFVFIYFYLSVLTVILVGGSLILNLDSAYETLQICIVFLSVFLFLIFTVLASHLFKKRKKVK